ncbi:MAG: GGDEF domain-containing protein [Sandaracinaceae bacterium]|jgi:diguanylate cyclase (GGDEF)-like protein|nr:GGDEF domain-containing protein [Sandaracinaceae bacterium]
MSTRGTRDEQTLRIGVRAEILTPREGLERNRPRLVVVAGDNVGHAYPLLDGAILGRGDVALRVNSEEVSRRHAEFTLVEGRWHVRDLGSMNGTLVNGGVIEARREIFEGDKIQVGTTIVRFALFDDVDERFQTRMYESALRDPLTRAYNRKYLEERIDSEFAYSLRHDTPLTLILFDIDHFKSVNDSWGHLAGDAVLAQLADHVLRVIRAEDVLARYGGEEFAILSRGIDREGARHFGERLRASVERAVFVYSAPMAQEAAGDEGLRAQDTGRMTKEDLAMAQRIPLTISVGAATMPDPEIGQPLHLLARADDALYRAKTGGRNRVRVHGLT